VLVRYCTKAIDDDFGVNEAGVEQSRYEVLVLLTESAELSDAQVLLVQAPPRVLRHPRRRGGVQVLDLDQAVAPAIGQDSSLLVNAIDTETVLLLER
jgi:hypothetical protein